MLRFRRVMTVGPGPAFALALAIGFGTPGLAASEDAGGPAAAGPFSPEIQELLETTYLGRPHEYPDPGEPYTVLAEYARRDTHYWFREFVRRHRTGEPSRELDRALKRWEAVAKSNPQSRHALVGLAYLLQMSSDFSGDPKEMRRAAELYLRAARIAFARGHIRYTHELSTLLSEMGDRAALDNIFQTLLAGGKQTETGFYYGALVDYARGLSRLGEDDGARALFERAIAFHPANSVEAIHHYAGHLLDRGEPAAARDVIDRHASPQLLRRRPNLARLRAEALGQLGLAPADEARASSAAGSPAFLYDAPQGKRPGRGEAGGITIQAAATNSDISTLFGVKSGLLKYAELYDGTNAKGLDSTMLAPLLADGTRVGVSKVAAFKRRNTNWGGVAIIGANSRVYARIFDGSTWGSWVDLGGIALDIAAVGYPNGTVDILVVGSDNKNLYRNRYNGSSWSGWGSSPWGCCGSEIAAAAMPNGTALAVVRGTNEALWYRYFDGTNWGGWNSAGGIVNDVTIVGYDPAPSGIKAGVTAVGSDGCTLYGNNWRGGTSWDGWFQLTSCAYNRVGSFVTGDGGAYILMRRTNGTVDVMRWNGSSWSNIVALSHVSGWNELAGANVLTRTTYVHDGADDCRSASGSTTPVYTVTLCGPTCQGQPCQTVTLGFARATVNHAEVLWNEARSETIAQQDLVGWTVRDRTFQSLTCGNFVGDRYWYDNNLTGCQSLPCTNSSRCDASKRYCCAIHGATNRPGSPTQQFDATHRGFADLDSSGLLYEAEWLMSNFVPEPSTNYFPEGWWECTVGCEPSGPWCERTCGVNPPLTDPAPSGPMQFLGYNSSCPYTCMTDRNNVCTIGVLPDNWFCNRKP